MFKLTKRLVVLKIDNPLNQCENSKENFLKLIILKATSSEITVLDRQLLL